MHIVGNRSCGGEPGPPRSVPGKQAESSEERGNHKAEYVIATSATVGMLMRMKVTGRAGSRSFDDVFKRAQAILALTFGMKLVEVAETKGTREALLSQLIQDRKSKVLQRYMLLVWD